LSRQQNQRLTVYVSVTVNLSRDVMESTMIARHHSAVYSSIDRKSTPQTLPLVNT
jgi:hypothetical protein